jgi:hypothetical protein
MMSAGCVASIQRGIKSDWRVELRTLRSEPDAVGECWESLIACHVAFQRDVWIGTYDAATIALVAPLREVTINGTTGYLLHSNEFDAFLDLRVT